MARPIPDMTQMTAAEVATDDSIIIDDTSAGETKRINAGDLLGLPKFGWTSSGEVWVFSSWNATTRIGIVTVPSNATTKYSPGMRVQLTQSTGGTKYGIIHAVSSTTLTIHFPSGITLNNESITTPYYSPLDTPFGFPKDPTQWELLMETNAQQLQATPTIGVWYNIGSNSLSLGVGSYDLFYETNIETLRANNADAYSTLSTANNTESDKKWTAWNFIGNGVASNNNVHPMGRRRRILLASATTFYLNFKSQAGDSQLQVRGADGHTRIVALTSYL